MAGRKKTVPMLIFVAMISITIGLAFLLGNYVGLAYARRRIRPACREFTPKRAAPPRRRPCGRPEIPGGARRRVPVASFSILALCFIALTAVTATGHGMRMVAPAILLTVIATVWHRQLLQWRALLHDDDPARVVRPVEALHTPGEPADPTRALSRARRIHLLRVVHVAPDRPARSSAPQWARSAIAAYVAVALLSLLARIPGDSTR